MGAAKVDGRAVDIVLDTQCSATASPRRAFAFCVNGLSFPPVKDQFGRLTTRRANLDARERNWQSAVERIKGDLEALGLGNFEELAKLCCPMPDQVREKRAARDSMSLRRKVVAWDDDFLASLIAP